MGSSFQSKIISVSQTVVFYQYRDSYTKQYGAENSRGEESVAKSAYVSGHTDIYACERPDGCKYHHAEKQDAQCYVNCHKNHNDLFGAEAIKR